MPQWTVEGANKATGKDTTLLVEAPTESAAREVAAAQGLIVAAISPSDQHMPSAASPHALDYARPTEARPLRFASVQAAAFTLVVLAFATYLIALLEAGVGLIAAISQPREMVPLLATVADAAFSALKTATLGAALQVLAALLPALALRLTPPKR